LIFIVGQEMSTAKKEHLAQLEEAIAVKDLTRWNHWRHENKYIVPDLSRANLIEANIGGVDLTKVNLSEANLTGAYLAAANLFCHGLDLRYVSWIIVQNVLEGLTSLHPGGICAGQIPDIDF
jgi:hypothetical protein